MLIVCANYCNKGGAILDKNKFLITFSENVILDHDFFGQTTNAME